MSQIDDLSVLFIINEKGQKLKTVHLFPSSLTMSLVNTKVVTGFINFAAGIFQALDVPFSMFYHMTFVFGAVFALLSTVYYACLLRTLLLQIFITPCSIHCWVFAKQILATKEDCVS